MIVEVVFLPRDLRPGQLQGKTAIVFDVLRATTSMAAALNAGVTEIRIFPDTAAAVAARETLKGDYLLCGELNALPPPGFDLGNSPRAFNAQQHEGRTLLMSTTNGTRAILAAREAKNVLIAALVTASAAARVAAEIGADITLICSGTNDQISFEDVLGCGAVLEALSRMAPVIDGSDANLIARNVFAAARPDLAAALRQTRGGRNVTAAGLAPDIDYCARLDSLDVVGRVSGESPVVRRIMSA